MLSYQEARKKVANKLSESLVILDELTIEKPYAWAFQYTSKLWLETGDIKYTIAGNSPIIVNKKTGLLTSYSSAYNTESAIEKYEEEFGIWELHLSETLIGIQKMHLLKSNLNLSNEQLVRLKKDHCISRGSQRRLLGLQSDLSKIGFQTKLVIIDQVT